MWRHSHVVGPSSRGGRSGPAAKVRVDHGGSRDEKDHDKVPMVGPVGPGHGARAAHGSGPGARGTADGTTLVGRALDGPATAAGRLVQRHREQYRWMEGGRLHLPWAAG